MRGPRWGASLRQKSQGPRGGDGPRAKFDEKKADDGPEPRGGSSKRVREVRRCARPGSPSGSSGRRLPKAGRPSAGTSPREAEHTSAQKPPTSPPAALFLVAGTRGNQVAFSQGTGTEEPHWAEKEG